MKMKFLHILSILIAISLSSCLSDHESSIESSRDIAYVTTIDNTPCVATSSGYVSAPLVKELKQQECYIIAYKITDLSNNGIYQTNDMTNISGSPLPQTALREASPTPDPKYGLAVKDLNIPIFAATDYMGDRWLFNYTATISKNENVISYFYYDKNNQIDENGKDISKDNKIIIDILFSKSEIVRSATMEDKKHLTVGNLESLRRMYTPDYSKGDSEKGVPVLIQFRYRKYINENRPYEETFFGSWSTNGTSRVYYMTFVKNK